MAPRLPEQSAPQPLGWNITACPETRTVVRTDGALSRWGRTVGLMGFGVAMIVFGAATVVLGQVPGGGPDDGGTGLGVAVVAMGAIAMGVGWKDRGYRGWAMTPEGLIVQRRFAWDGVAWVGLTVHRDDHDRIGFRLQARDDEHGPIDIGNGTRERAERLEAMSRALAGAWLVGAVPSDVTVVLAPPPGGPPEVARDEVRDELGRMGRAVMDGRWAEMHDHGRLDGATIAPADAHGEGLERLDALAPDAEAILDAARPGRRTRLRWRPG